MVSELFKSIWGLLLAINCSLISPKSYLLGFSIFLYCWWLSCAYCITDVFNCNHFHTKEMTDLSTSWRRLYIYRNNSPHIDKVDSETLRQNFFDLIQLYIMYFLMKVNLEYKAFNATFSLISASSLYYKNFFHFSWILSSNQNIDSFFTVN